MKTKKQKKPYQPPRLVKYGDLRQITQGGGGSKSEGKQKPITKA
jgi:hypothetical protein